MQTAGNMKLRRSTGTLAMPGYFNVWGQTATTPADPTDPMGPFVQRNGKHQRQRRVG